MEIKIPKFTTDERRVTMDEIKQNKNILVNGFLLVKETKFSQRTTEFEQVVK
jgi:hypothetical protein